MPNEETDPDRYWRRRQVLAIAPGRLRAEAEQLLDDHPDLSVEAARAHLARRMDELDGGDVLRALGVDERPAPRDPAEEGLSPDELLVLRGLKALGSNGSEAAEDLGDDSADGLTPAAVERALKRLGAREGA